jgi:hypothetical protein
MQDLSYETVRIWREVSSAVALKSVFSRSEGSDALVEKVLREVTRG